MRIIRYAVLFIIGITLVTLALANRDIVTLRLLPEGLASSLGFGAGALQLPLFLVILFGILIGLILGVIWEYLRESKYRSELSKKNSEVRRLEREVSQPKEEAGEEQDEILDLLERS